MNTCSELCCHQETLKQNIRWNMHPNLLEYLLGTVYYYKWMSTQRKTLAVYFMSKCLCICVHYTHMYFNMLVNIRSCSFLFDLYGKHWEGMFLHQPLCIAQFRCVSRGHFPLWFSHLVFAIVIVECAGIIIKCMHPTKMTIGSLCLAHTACFLLSPIDWFEELWRSRLLHTLLGCLHFFRAS